MKKLFNIGMIAFLMAITLVSCSKDDDDDDVVKLDDRLVGTKWQCDDPVRKAFFGGICYQIYEFTSTTKVEKYNTRNGSVDKVAGEFDYILNYPDITINETDSDGNANPKKYKFVDSRTMHFVNEDGTLSDAIAYAIYYKQ
ncbi:MAG: hypothetical protein J6Y82_04845 [Bacteroidales bacterium]|nr:hypothetical protein [Bacteroidales bacterium]